ncbi:MAG TPA: ERCC4-type nuclease, partial [Thermoplasmatales archaeon]|nr:ERCC4-type nuclease [Thermoplasmatales archaeon]
EHFGSIAAVANATIEELREVDGVGEKKATQIYEAFH